MTTPEIMDLIRQLREMGATGVTITAEGGVSAQFGQPKVVTTGPAELSKPIAPKKHPSKPQDPPPPEAARQEWRDKIVSMANGTP